MEQLGEALRLLRVFHDCSQTELAERLQMSKSFLSEIESGKKEPTLNLLSRYAEEFRVPLSSLLFFAESVSARRPNGPGEAVAPKVLKLLNWVSDLSPPRKPVQRQLNTSRKKTRFGS
jgi:transcriptional regulator with XRE-family HTH domain